MRRKISIAAAILLGGLLLPVLALADVVVQFNNSTASVVPGSSVVISGSVTNTDSQDLYINGFVNLSVTDPSGAVAVDQAATLGYLPAVLSAGQVYQGPLVKVNTAFAAAAGQYSGVYNLAGGSATTTLNSLGSNNFIVTVSGTASQASSSSASLTIDSPTAVTLASSTSSSTVTNPAPSSSVSGLAMPDGYDGSNNSSYGTGLQMPADSGLQSPTYPDGPRLIQLDGDTVVYWVSPNNLKIPMNTTKVFLSYNNKWEDVQTVSQDEFDYYQDAKYIWLNGQGGIYKINGTTKSLISIDAWAQAGVDPSQIITVNKTDFNSFKTGSKITDPDQVLN